MGAGVAAASSITAAGLASSAVAAVLASSGLLSTVAGVGPSGTGSTGRWPAGLPRAELGFDGSLSRDGEGVAAGCAAAAARSTGAATPAAAPAVSVAAWVLEGRGLAAREGGRVSGAPSAPGAPSAAAPAVAPGVAGVAGVASATAGVARSPSALPWALLRSLLRAVAASCCLQLLAVSVPGTGGLPGARNCCTASNSVLLSWGKARCTSSTLTCDV